MAGTHNPSSSRGRDQETEVQGQPRQKAGKTKVVAAVGRSISMRLIPGKSLTPGLVEWLRHRSACLASVRP
jgi:hypothetical protein